jgi:hypothetical protein
MAERGLGSSFIMDQRRDTDREILASQGQMEFLLNSLTTAENSDNMNINNSMGAMSNWVRDFAINQKEIEKDFTDIHESFKNGMLTHDRLESMICGEQVRTSFLVNLIGNLKVQLEHLFSVVHSSGTLRFVI